MKTQKVFATSNEAITIRCPECMKESNIQMQKINNRHELKVRCACKATFLLQVEFRKRKRKPTNFEGRYKKRERLEFSKVNWNYRGINCKIVNISQDGIGILSNASPNLQIGDIIVVNFSLGSSALRTLEKDAIVRHINGNYLGCEFTENHKNDKLIGFFVIS